MILKKGCKVLIVDDDTEVLSTTSLLLREAGCIATTTTNASEALSHIRKEDYDVVLTDIKLHEASGFELVKRIKEIDPDIPVIFMTGFAELDMAIRAIRKGAFDFITKPFDPELLIQSLNRAAKYHELISMEKNYKKELEGRVREKTKVLETTIELLQDEINERKKTEEKLRETLQTSNDIVQTIPSGLFTYQYVAPDRLVLIDGNPEAERLTGLVINDWRGKEFSDIWPEAEQRGVTAAFLNVMTSGETYITEDYHYKDERLEGAFKVHAFKIPGERLAVAFENITNRKKAEEALLKANDEIETWNKKLEQRVREKSDELAQSQAQLLQSEKLSAMGRMAGGLAHELNSPLAGLLPMIEKYRDMAETGSETYGELTLMLKACNYMARIVKSFVDFSREAKGETEVFSLNQAIEDTLSFSTSRLRQKHVLIVKDYDEKLPMIRGERTEMQQVILNMLTNAIDSIRKSGQLTIKTASVDNGETVYMSFRDTGSGMPRENHDKIFDPFFTTKKPGEGVGLGLSVSYKIIEKHGGNITIESEPGKGSIFTIYLPSASTPP